MSKKDIKIMHLMFSYREFCVLELLLLIDKVLYRDTDHYISRCTIKINRDIFRSNSWNRFYESLVTKQMAYSMPLKALFLDELIELIDYYQT